MKSIKGITTIIAFAGILTLGIYALINTHTESIASVDVCGHGQIEPDRELSARLVRFGQVAFDRGQFTDAKHFFQKAIMVDPSHLPAWKKYNLALLALISAKVETDPGFLPEPAPNPDHSESNRKVSSGTTGDDDGC